MENRRIGLNKITRTLNLEGKCIDMILMHCCSNLGSFSNKIAIGLVLVLQRVTI